MAAVDDLVTWLRAQLDEDERGAQAASDPDDQWWWSTPESPAEEHIARYSPARVLAEVDAKRRILDEHEPYPQQQRMVWKPGDVRDVTVCSTCGSVDDSPVEWPCPTVRLLALPYADRPGYRPEWKP